jgi:hypothetical protein
LYIYFYIDVIAVLVDIVIKRKLNHAETSALNTYYNNINISDNIEVFRHAETTKGVYRDYTVEADRPLLQQRGDPHDPIL